MMRTLITPVLLGCALALGSSQAFAAQAEPAQGEDEPLTMAEASMTALTHAIETAPLLVWPDASAPASLARYVPVARQQLLRRAIDRLLWPLHLRFVEARCSSDGKVALVFEEVRPLLPWRTFAVAWRGSMPTSPDQGWGGGTGMASVLDDAEFVQVMGSDTFACP